MRFIGKEGRGGHKSLMKRGHPVTSPTHTHTHSPCSSTISRPAAPVVVWSGGVEWVCGAGAWSGGVELPSHPEA